MSIFKEYYIDILTKKYFKFSGRASRGEFWYFFLFNFFVSLLISSLDLTLFLAEIKLPTFLLGGEQVPISLSLIYMLFTFIPSIALLFRRLHDIGKSAWWLLIIFIPILGMFILLYFQAKAGDKGQNKYGDNPLEEDGFQAKSMGALTVVAILVLLIVANVAFIILVLGVTLSGLALSMQNEINGYMDVQQKVTTTNSTVVVNNKTISNNKVTISVPLNQNYVLKYSNVKLCTPESKKDEMFFSKVIAENYGVSTSCSNEVCEVSIGIDDPAVYPTEVEMWVKDDSGKCTKEKVPSSTPEVAGYSAKIKLTPELLSSINVTNNSYDISSQNTANYSMLSLDGVNVIQFDYENKLASDTILINKEPKINVVFDKDAVVNSSEESVLDENASVENTPKSNISEVNNTKIDISSQSRLKEIEMLKKDIAELKNKLKAFK